MSSRLKVFWAVLAVIVSLALYFPSGFAASPEAKKVKLHEVVIPEEDRFEPFGLIIHAGDSVRWTNQDGDDHRVVSVNAFDTKRYRDVDELLLGTTNNGGVPSTFKKKFSRPGLFIYYCRIHSQLDAHNQPVNVAGIPETPMMGVVTVIP